MFLTLNNVAIYLIHSGLVSASSVVNDGFFLVEAGRRNRNFKVYLGGRPGLFIKQIQSTVPQAIATLQREANFYGRLDAGQLDGRTRELMPRLVHYDAGRCILIVELVPGALNLSEYHAHDIRRLPATSHQLAIALSALHARLPAVFNAAEPLLFPLQLPWALTLDQAGHERIRQLGPAGVYLSSALQNMPGLESLLGSLRSWWQWETVIHGDMKWENALLNLGENLQSPLRVVDWELIDFGDSAWDVASLLKEYIIYGIFTLLDGGSTPQGSEALLVCAHSAREFFRQYLTGRQMPPAMAPMYAGRCVRLTAARLVAAVLEYPHFNSGATQVADLILRTALTLLRQPRQAAWNLLGMAAV